MTKIISLYLHKYKFQLLLFIMPVVFVACANMASPTGGDYDFDPPRVIKSTPEFNATNVTSNKIQIEFDELVKVDKPLEKILVTPPQQRLPVIRAVSNKVRVELRDTLLPNTTYTIDFTDAIVDNNEGNALENFSISFSTGDHIDTLAVSGKVLEAQTLEPVKGIYVGLHSDLTDTAFITKPFERISRTNERGEFTIRGIAGGEYKVYALDDINRVYKYENPANAIAFYDSVIIPTQTEAIRTDTVYNLEMEVDTLIRTKYTRFLPDDIILRSFISSFQRQYLQKYERPVPDRLEIYFGAPTSMPQIEPLNFPGENQWAVLERSGRNDTLRYWLTDPEIIEMDTLLFRMAYHITDTLDNIVPQIDTLRFINRGRKPQKENKNKEEDNITFLMIETNLKSIMNVYDNISFGFNQPVYDFEQEKIHLQRLVDSIYVEESFLIIPDSLSPLRYKLAYKWNPGENYRLYVDSAAFHSYAGFWNDKFDRKFSVRKLDEYGNFILDIIGLDAEMPAFVELLDASDKPLRKSIVKNNEAHFFNLDPGIYYARITLDENGNGVWDTGDYYEKREPEMVYYYNGSFEIKANWDIEESWNIRSLPLDKQKPLEITRNKPQEKESRRQKLEEQEERERRRNQQNQERNRNQNINNMNRQQTSTFSTNPLQ